MPTPITLRAMWACYNNAGAIIFASIAWTKEESEAATERAMFPVKNVELLRRGYVWCMVAVDIVPVDGKI